MQATDPYAPPESHFPEKTLPAGQLAYAGFWRRFGAYWIDAVVLAPLSVVSYFMGEQSRMFMAYFLLPSLILTLLFHVYLVVRYGGTPGKLLLKTRIAMVDGAPVTYKAALLRHLPLMVLSALLGICMVMATMQMTDQEYFSVGYMERSFKLVGAMPSWFWIVNVSLNVWVWGEFVTMLTNKKRRAIHDFLAGTVVLRTT